MDHLVWFKSHLKEASVRNLHTVVIVLDIEKVYYAMWKHEYFKIYKIYISKDMYQILLKILYWIAYSQPDC